MYQNNKKLRQGIDHTKPGYWFITIRTKAGFPRFGILGEDRIYLNTAGQIAEKCLLKIPEIYSETELHGHIVMCEHIHLVLELKKTAGTPRSVSTIISFYKRQVSLELHKADPQSPINLWQPSFWGKYFLRVGELVAYQKYMADNPKKEKEKYRSKNAANNSPEQTAANQTSSNDIRP